MNDHASGPQDLKTPVRAVCPRCGTENSFIPARTPYLYCRHCHYVYAWINRDGRLVIEGKSLSPRDPSDK